MLWTWLEGKRIFLWFWHWFSGDEGSDPKITDDDLKHIGSKIKTDYDAIPLI